MEVNVSLSALKPSAYREFVKGWDKTRYDALFRMFTDNPKAYRIYLDPADVDSSVSEDSIDSRVLAALQVKGIKIDDYVGGYGIDSHGRRVKLGRVLDSEVLRQRFANDPIRQASKNGEFACVISRHPYDIAGMSADRGWTSCMSIPTSHPGTVLKNSKRIRNYPDTKKPIPKESIVNHGGSNARYLKPMINAGTLIAYWIRRTDENINHPSARILLKVYKDATGATMLRPSDMYGTAPKQFAATVAEWCDKVNKEFFHVKTLVTYDLASGQYSDASDPADVDTMPKTFDGSHIEHIAQTLGSGDYDTVRRLVRMLVIVPDGTDPNQTFPALASALNLAIHKGLVRSPIDLLAHVLGNLKQMLVEPDLSPAISDAYKSIASSCGLLAEAVLESPKKHKINPNPIFEGATALLKHKIGTVSDLFRITLACKARVNSPIKVTTKFTLVWWMKNITSANAKVSVAGVRTNYALAFLAFVIVVTKAKTLKSITWPVFSKQLALLLRNWDVDLKTLVLSIPVICLGRAVPTINQAYESYADVIQKRPFDDRAALLKQLPVSTTVQVRDFYQSMYSKVYSNRVLSLLEGMWSSSIYVSSLKMLLGTDVYDAASNAVEVLAKPKKIQVNVRARPGERVRLDFDLTQPVADQIKDSGVSPTAFARSLVESLSSAGRDKERTSAFTLLGTSDAMIDAAVRGCTEFADRFSGSRSTSPTSYAACLNHLTVVFDSLRESITDLESPTSDIDAALDRADRELAKLVASIPRPTKVKNALDLAALVGSIMACAGNRRAEFDTLLSSKSKDVQRAALSVLCSTGASWRLDRYSNLTAPAREALKGAYMELCSFTGAGRSASIVDDESYFGGDFMYKLVHVAPDLYLDSSDDDEYTCFFSRGLQSILKGKDKDPFNFIQVGNSVIDSVNKTREWVKTTAGSDAVRRLIRTISKQPSLTGLRTYYLLALVEPDQLVAEHLSLGLISPYTAKLFSGVSSTPQSISNVYEYNSSEEVHPHNKLFKLVVSFTYGVLRCRRIPKFGDVEVLPLEVMTDLSLRAHAENSELAYGGSGLPLALASYWRSPNMIGLSMSEVDKLSRQELIDWVRFYSDDRFVWSALPNSSSPFTVVRDEDLREVVAGIRRTLFEDKISVPVAPPHYENFCVPLLSKSVKAGVRHSMAESLVGSKMKKDDDLSIAVIAAACVMYAVRWSQSPTFVSDVNSLSHEQIINFLTNAGLSGVFFKNSDSMVVPERPFVLDDDYDSRRPRQPKEPVVVFDLKDADLHELRARFIKAAPLLQTVYLASVVLTGQHPKPVRV